MPTPISDRARMANLVMTLHTLDAQQQTQPGYGADIAAAIIAAELARIERDSESDIERAVR
jgi:hypothetical protein